MCQINSKRHPIHCILPSYILESIIRNGTPAQREEALLTYDFSHTFRTMRVIESSLASTATPVQQGNSLQTAAVPQVQRTIYNAHNQITLPGDVARVEGQAPTGDLAIDEAYTGLGDTFNFYWQAYGRNSIDDQGLPLLASVHYGVKFDNAFWNGKQMVFGDGDGQFFNRFTIALDVIGHELTHGVTQTDAKLIFHDQSGALNESISDVFGSLVKQFALKQTATQADWLIGAGLFTANVQGVALRSMKAPGTAFNDPILGKDLQPAHMKDYVQTLRDNGGVHINSGIPNHAFYLVATALGGQSWEKAGRIWYDTLRNPTLKPDCDFQTFAQLTANTADTLYGQGSAEGQAVRNAWNQVGIATTVTSWQLNGQSAAHRQDLKRALAEISNLLSL